MKIKNNIIKRQCHECRCKNTEKCEIELFLKDFVNHTYNVDLYNLRFRCPDKEIRSNPQSPKSVDLEFKIGTKLFAIEAKGLNNIYLCKMIHASQCIDKSIIGILDNMDNMRKIFGEDAEEFIGLLKKYGLRIQFYEDVLYATNILGKSICTSPDLVKDILMCSLKTLRIADSNMKKGDTNMTVREAYSLDKKKYNKKVNKAKEIEALSLVYKKNKIEKQDLDGVTYPPYNVFQKTIDKNILWYRMKGAKESAYDNICSLDERITFSIEINQSPKGFRTGINYDVLLLKAPEVLNEYWKNKVDSTNEKMKKYNSKTKRILFINNEGYRLTFNSDMYKNIIKIIERNASRYKNIDEIWLEYYKTELYEDNFDSIQFIETKEKEYQKIWSRK